MDALACSLAAVWQLVEKEAQKNRTLVDIHIRAKTSDV
jgi:hypothetical protein